MMNLLIQFKRPSSWKTPKKKVVFDTVDRLVNRKFAKDFDAVCKKLKLDYVFFAVLNRETMTFEENRPVMVEVIGERNSHHMENLISMHLLDFFLTKKIEINHYAYIDDSEVVSRQIQYMPSLEDNPATAAADFPKRVLSKVWN